MFDRLHEKLGQFQRRIQGMAHITEKDIERSLREIRIILLEADVALPVVRALMEKLRKEALGAKVSKSLQPGQVILKILYDALVDLLGGEPKPLDLREIPSVVLVCGLQGAGKTTTVAKLALHLRERGKKVGVSSVDMHRPAAREQLQILANQIDVPYIEVDGSDAAQMAMDALHRARKEGLHVLLLDTAGRQVVDDVLMEEIRAIAKAVKAKERLLILDSMTGQTALEVAERFHEAIGLSGCILTKADADARGGAALSVVKAVGVPIRFLGTGEKLDAFEPFDPKRMAGRILGRGDVIGLVEKVQRHVDEASAQKMAAKAKRGRMDLMDFAKQLETVQKMGGVTQMLKMLPGVGLPQDQISAIDERPIKRMQAIIYSMTPEERRKPAILNGSRKRRIAAGSGTSVQEVNQLLRQFAQMQKMMKRMKGGKGRRLLRQFAGKGFPGL